MRISRFLQYAFIAIIVTTVGFSLYQWNASRAAVKLQQSTSVNLTNGLVGYWTFDGDDVSGTTAYDRSGSANNGTLTNGPTRTAGRIGQALNFDGVDDVVAVPDADVFTQSVLTVSFWKKDIDAVANRQFVGKRSSGNRSWGIMGSNADQALQFIISDTGSDENNSATTPNGVMAVGQWHHVVAVFNGAGTGNAGRMQVYINGVNQSLTFVGTIPATLVNNTKTVDIGSISGAVSQFYGSIDDVRIYNRALSAGEVQSLYDLGNPDKVNTSQGDPLEQGLVGYWKLDDASGTTATDSSGNANAGTLTNGPTWGTGRIGGDVVFDGVDDYINFGALSALTNPWSLSLWVNRQGDTSAGVIFNDYGGVNSDWSIDLEEWNNTHKVGITHYGVANYASTYTAPIGTWVHLVFISNGTNTLLYVNGTLNYTFTGVVAKLPRQFFARTTNPLVFTNAYFDEVRIYNRALSDEEVTKLYRTTTPDNPDTGLVGYWPMNGKDINGTTAYDRSGKGNTGTLTNGPTRTAGKIGQALTFDGVDDYIDVVNTSFSGTFTFSTWFYTSNNAQTGIIFGEQTADGGPKPKIGMNGGNFFVRIDSVGLSVDNSVAIPVANQWHHFVLSRDGSNKVDLYVDGVRTRLFGDVAQPNTYILDKLSSNGNPSQWFNGRLDEPRIYSRALSAGEVQSLYDLGNPDKVNTPQGDPLEQGLVGYWKLDDASGTTATDSSGNANTGTLTNGPTWGTGRIGGDTVFDGTDDYIDAGAFTNLSGSFTVSTWMYITGTTGTVQDLVSKFGGTAATMNFLMEVDSGGTSVSFFVGDGNSSNAASATVSLGQWYFVTGVWDGTNTKIYLNGNFITKATNPLPPDVSGTNLFIGSRSGTLRFTNGSLDEVRVYNRALSDEEVTKLYRETTPDNPDTGLVGYWPMNGKDINGTTAYDRSGKGNTGTLTNGPTRTAGKIGQALTFDGVDDYVSMSGVPVTSFPLTTIVWFKTTNATASYRTISSLYGSANSALGVIQFDSGGGGCANSSRVKYIARDNSGSTSANICSLSNVNDGIWHQAVGVSASASDHQLYIDGVSQGTSSTALGTTTFNTMRVGSHSGAQFFPGQIDEPRVYNRALSAGEIQSLYNSGR